MPVASPGSSLISDRELLHTTARSVVRSVEWTNLWFQAATLAWSATYDHYSTAGRLLIIALVPAHLALLPTYLRGNGPFSRGGAWTIVGIVESFAMYGLAAAISDHHAYAMPYLYLSNYAAGTWVLLAFYPWAPHSWTAVRPFVVAALLALCYGYFLVLIWATHATIGWVDARNALLAMSWSIVGYVLGKACELLSRTSAQSQLEIQRRNFNQFFDFLHSNVKAGIAAVREHLPANQTNARERLKELEAAVSDYRVELALALEQVPLAAVFSERVRAFVGTIQILETPRVGALTVPRPVGIVVGRALGDLLTNAVVHGAHAVRIQFDFDAVGVQLRITDDGPGFADDVLDDEATSLHRLRESARILGGDLTKVDSQLRGVRMTLIVPLSKAWSR